MTLLKKVWASLDSCLDTNIQLLLGLGKKGGSKIECVYGNAEVSKEQSGTLSSQRIVLLRPYESLYSKKSIHATVIFVVVGLAKSRFISPPFTFKSRALRRSTLALFHRVEVLLARRCDVDVLGIERHPYHTPQCAKNRLRFVRATLNTIFLPYSRGKGRITPLSTQCSWYVLQTLNLSSLYLVLSLPSSTHPILCALLFLNYVQTTLPLDRARSQRRVFRIIPSLLRLVRG